jgi:hypothetical protein
MRDFSREYRVISHAQIELLAARVSALYDVSIETTSHALLLRASGATYNRSYELATVTRAVDGDGGVPHGNLLIRFAEAVLGEDDPALTRPRDALMAALGPAGLVDAAPGTPMSAQP